MATQSKKQIKRQWGGGERDALKQIVSALQGLIFGEVTVDPASLAATTAAETTVALPAGTAAAGALVFVQPPSSLNAGIAVMGARISATDTLAIRLYNTTGLAIDVASATWTYFIVTAPDLEVI